MPLVTKEQFLKLTTIVIDNFEGGYYHPDMLTMFSKSDQDLLRASGETMFGLDRKAGAQLAIYPEWAEFWKLIDDDKKINKWRYQSRGGKLEFRLKELAATIMYQWFLVLSSRYLLTGASQAIANDDRLILHFSYASWNGEGWFKKYATALNNAITKFPNDKNAIFNEAIKARTQATTKLGLPNRAIRQQGKNMLDLFRRLKLV